MGYSVRWIYDQWTLSTDREGRKPGPMALKFLSFINSGIFCRVVANRQAGKSTRGRHANRVPHPVQLSHPA
ncbi:hypothetical protein EMIT0P43_110215 [Pseudomonas jessenii]